MNTQYITPPPPFARLPKFIYKWYPQKVLGDLMRWADNEYNARIKWANEHDLALAQILYKEWSGMRILAMMEGFRWICAQLDEDTHRKIDRRTYKFIRKSYEMYELLRKGILL